MNELLERLGKLTQKQLMLLAFDQHRQLEAASQKRPEPIAVIGMGCRFPGGGDGPEAFWELLREGRDAIREVPSDRWDINRFFHPDPDAPARMAVRSGGFLDDVGGFDAAFFGISPREAVAMDPQQRLLLEVTWEALEHANVAADQLMGSATGVFVGLCNSDHFHRMLRRGNAAIDAYLASGNAPSVAAGRIAYCLGLRGPALTVDTSCSASLVAIHLACQSLRGGESRVALAGGANVICSPETMIALSKAHMLAPDGRCKTFDAAADGFARGEGCGVLVLKRLSDALSDGDTVHAVIRGVAVNQDGRSGGLTVPNGPAQENVIRAALESSGANPDEIDYVEAHGTGTPLGDPIEIHALSAVLGAQRPNGAPLLVGSVKTNIGHLEAAAGVAGVIKVVLALQHGSIPPHLHFRHPSTHISWKECNIAVAGAEHPWARGGRARIAGVSSFGFSGTNAHAIIEEAPRTDRKISQAEPRSFHCLPLSARSETALAKLAARYGQVLSNRLDLPLENVVHTAGAGRSRLPQRLAVVADTTETAVDALQAFAAGRPHPALRAGAAPGQRPEVVFVFSGGDSAYPSMGRRLYEASSAYRQAVDHCDRIVGPDAFGHTLKTVLWQVPTNEMPADAPVWSRLILLASQYAAVQLWKSFGVEPAAVIGDGDGEYAAACAAGVFSIEDGLRVVAERATLGADSSLKVLPPRIPVAWTAGGRNLPKMEAAPDAAYWANHGTEPGDVADGCRRLKQEGYSSFLEVTPNPSFSGRARLCLKEEGTLHSTSPAPDQDEWKWIAHRLADLHVRGVKIDWAQVTKGAGKCVLPTYPFERRSYWYSPRQLDELSAGAPGHIGPQAASDALPSDAGATPSPTQSPAEDLFYQVVWKEAPPPVRAAPSLLSPKQFAPTVRERFAVLADQNGLSIYDRLLPELDRLSGAYLVCALRQLGFDASVGRVFDVEQEAARLRIAPRHLRLFRCLLESLADGRVVQRHGATLEIIGPLLAVDAEHLMHAAFAKFGEVDGELGILRRCGAALAQVLTGEQDPLELLFPGGEFKEARRLYVESPAAKTYNKALAEALGAAIERLPAGATLRVLEIGAGTGGTTSYVLPRLPAGRVEYVFTDMSQLFLERAVGQFGAYDFLRTNLLDIEKNPFDQGFLPAQFDVVIAANVLHATQDLRQTVAHVRSLIAPGGLLCLLEAVQPLRWADCTFGLTEGWWRFVSDGIRKDHPLIDWAAWRNLLKRSGFTDVMVIPDEEEAAPRRSQKGLMTNGLFFARASSGGRRWTLVGDDASGVGAELEQRLLARGDSVVSCGSYAEEAIAAADGSLVYLGALELADRANDDPAALASCKRLACSLPLQLLAQIAPGSGRAWLVTRGAQPARGPLSTGARWQAPLWGIGRTFALEHPGRLGGLVDLPAAGSSQECANALLAALDAEDSEDQTAWRDGMRLVPRLTRATAPAQQPMAFGADATYLITGGFGRIGLRVARWMAELGAQHLALVGRRPDVSSDAIRLLQERGIQIFPVAGDLADEASMAAVFDRLAAEAPPVRGVVHCAAEFGAVPIAALTPADIDRTLRPKIDGAVVLERLTQALDLDFLVLFSSAASVLGAANYAHYAAANSFLDATGEAAHGCGRRVIVANWGAWEGSADENQEFRDGGLVPMQPAVALNALGQMMFNNAPPRVIGRFDWSVLRPLLEARHTRPLLADLTLAPADRQVVQRPAAPEASGSLTERLARTPPDMRRAVLEDFVHQEVAAVLGLAADDPVPPDTGFFDLGMDSLTSVELRRRLERGIGLSLPSSLTFSYPNLQAMTDFLARKLGEPEETKEGLQVALPPPLEATVLDDLTDCELESRLLARLQEVR